MNKITLEEIKIFLTVAENLNFTKASRILYLSQPTVTKWVKHLESQLGVVLFKRNSKHVALTPSGELLYKKWISLIEDWENSVKQAQQLNGSYKSIIRIGVLYGFEFETLLSEILMVFERSHPEIKTECSVYDFSEMRKRLDTLDFIFTTNYEMEGLCEYQTIRIDEIPLFLAVSKKHPFSQKKYLLPEDIINETFLIFSPQISPKAISHLRKAFANYGVEPSFISIENIPSQILKISRNQGVAITNEIIVKGHEKYIKLVPIKNFQMDIFRVCACRNKARSESEKEFYNYMLSKYSDINLSI